MKSTITKLDKIIWSLESLQNANKSDLDKYMYNINNAKMILIKVINDLRDKEY